MNGNLGERGELGMDTDTTKSVGRQVGDSGDWERAHVLSSSCYHEVDSEVMAAHM